MAHGYLTPTPVGEKDIFRTVGDLLDRFKKEGDKNGAPPEGGSDLAVVQKAGKSKVYKQARTSNEKEQKNVNLLVTRMGGVLSNMIGRGSSQEQSMGGVKKGGSFVNMGASTKPISDTTFFKSAVVEGVNPLTGEYYSPEDRIAAFKKYRPKERTTQGVGVSGGAAADIVAALARNTLAVARMEDAVNRQTDNDTRIATKEIQAQDTIFNRLLASQKENRLEQGSDFSGNRRPLPVGAGRGGSGGSGGRRGGGIGQNLANIGGNVVDIASKGKKGAIRAGEALASSGKPIRSGVSAIQTISSNVSKSLKIQPKLVTGFLEKATKARNFIKNPLTAFKYGQAMADAAKDMASAGFFKGIKNVDTQYELLKGIGGGAKAMNKSLAAIYAGGGSVDDFTKVLLSGGMPADELIEAGTNKGVVSGFKKFSQDADKIAKNVSPKAAEAIAPSRINQLDNAGLKAADIATDQVVKKGVKQGLKKGSSLTRLMVKNFGAAGTRSILKKIPVVAGLAGIAFGIQRALEGDFIGAGLEITSGILGAISPLTAGAGTGASLAIDGYLLARDLGVPVPLAKGGILSAATNVVAGEAGDEAYAPLEGAEGKIAGSVFGKASGEALANFFKKKPLEKLRYNSDHPEGINQPNPHPPGTFLYRNFERLRQMNIIDPSMKISQSHNFMPRNTNKGTALANSSAEVASGDRKNNSKNNTVIMESPAGTDNKGNSGLPLTSNPAGGSEDQGLSMYAAHLVMASV